MTPGGPHPVVMTRNAFTWTAEYAAPSGGRAPLDAIPDRDLDALRELGTDLVWLLGVWRRGPIGLSLARDNPAAHPAYNEALPGWAPSDVTGSPYSVAAYEVDDALGGADALARLRARLDARGMGLLLDFVPNHLGRDHRWVHDHPERLVTTDVAAAKEDPIRWFRADTVRGPRAVAFGKDPHFAGWIDTVQLDWSREETRHAMRDELRRVAGQCDGVRCDMAMLLLGDVFARTWPETADRRPDAEWWPDAIAAAREVRPGFLFLAEVYWGLEGRLLELGFDHVYHKGLYDDLRSGDPGRIHAALAADPYFLQHAAHFVENHDETPARTAFPDGRDVAAAAITLGLPGLRLLHEGQLTGRTIRLPVQLGRASDPGPVSRTVAFLSRFVPFLGDPLLRTGRFFRPEVPEPGDGRADGVVALGWERADAWALILANLDPGERTARVRIPMRPVAGARVRLHDVLDPEASGDPTGTVRPPILAGDALVGDGLPVTIEGRGARVLRIDLDHR